MLDPSAPTSESGERAAAVVTGAAREGSIGRAIALRLLKDGFRVVISDLEGGLVDRPEYDAAEATALERTATELSAYGEVEAIACDVRDATQVQALIDGAIARFGRIDALVNNAGLAVGVVPVVELSEADWQLNLDVMATGVFLCSRAAARRMIDQGQGGAIVTIASQSAKTGFPLLGAYTAAKFAALGLTQVLAHELGPHQIRVNAVCPGTIDTPLLAVRGGVFDAYTQMTGTSLKDYRRRLTRQIPLGRFGAPEDVADTVAFLVSPSARYITGESINVTGGQEMH
jgi:NAD(P)-dependent dehydrogenase (short-subunit alcohol dehydrogenase family)